MSNRILGSPAVQAPVSNPDILEETEREIRALPETPERKTREQILLDAADLIERAGYEAGNRGVRLDGGFCILGAVAHSGGMRVWGSWDGPAYRMDDPARLLGVPMENAYEWNDTLTSKRTHRSLGRKIPRAERVATCLRLVASGVPFDEAKLRA